jgi:riboflavin kinase/FMN adenylyltransferase
VVVGADFCFGKGRTGTADMLREFGREIGFDVTIAPLLEGSAGCRVLDRDPHRAERGRPARGGRDAGPLAPDRGARPAW